MVPYARDPSLTLDQKLTSILLPLADVVLLAVLVRLLSGGGRRPAAYWLLGLSVTAPLAADTVFGVGSLREPFLPGSPIDAGFIDFLLGCGAAARCTRPWPSSPLPAPRLPAGVPVGARPFWAPPRSWPGPRG